LTSSSNVDLALMLAAIAMPGQNAHIQPVPSRTAALAAALMLV